MNFKKIIKGLSVFALALVSGIAQAQEISPMLVGNNAWFTNPTDEVWALTGESGVKTIRIGGNAFNDNMPSNATLLSWVQEIRAIGAEPILQVSQHQSAEAAANVVHFFNVEMSGQMEPIKYWNIGNEPWLEANRPPIPEVAPLVEAYFKPIAVAMKAVDPSIKIYGPDFAYYIEEAINDLFGGANDIAGKIPGQDYYYCDGISWHRYPQDENINLATQGIADFQTGIVKCKQKVDAINAEYNRTGEDALQWGIGEYNAKGGVQVHTFENGQMFGGVLGLCMKYEATYAATWSMFENGGSRTGTDFSFIDGANMTPRSSYRHMEFVAKYFTGNYLEGTTSDSDIFIYGAQDEERTAVMIMNRGTVAPKEYTLHLNTDATTGDNVVLKVAGGLGKSHSDFIGSRTTQVIIFEADSIIKFNYSAADFENERAPSKTLLAMATALPATPGELSGDGISFKEITLNWKDNSDNETGFIIERKVGGAFEIIGIATTNQSSYTDEGLTAETAYEYRVSAYNGIGKSSFSNEVSVTTAEEPAQIPFNGPHNLPGRIQTEDFNSTQGIGYNDLEPENRGGFYRLDEGVDIEVSTDEGGGFNVGYINPGEYLNYSIITVEEGNYNFDIRLASNTTGEKQINISIDGQPLGSITPTNTGGWQIWQTYTLNNIPLEAAEGAILRLSFEGSEYNINWFEMTKTSITSNIDRKDDSKINIWYNSNQQSIYIDLDEKTPKIAVKVFDLTGRVQFSTEKKDFLSGSLNHQQLKEGIYLVSVTTNQSTYLKRIFVY